MRNRSRSLRYKLTLWYVLVFFALQAVLVGTVVLVRRESIRSSLEDELDAAAVKIVDNILTWEGEVSADLKLAEMLPANAGLLFCGVRDEGGEMLSSWNLPQPEDLPFLPYDFVPTGPVGAVFRPLSPERSELLTGSPERVQTVTLPFRYGERLYYLQAGVRDQLLERLLGPFIDLVVVGVPVGVLAATLAAWVIAGRAVRPLDQLAQAARAVSPERLGERFDAAAADEEISRLAEELNLALERIEAGFRAQDQFISNVSHELKTPIAVLLLEAQVARLGERSPEEAVAFAAQVERELKRLGRLVESFLVLARAQQAGNRPLPGVSVYDLVLQAVQHGRTLAAEAEVRLIPNLTFPEDADDPMVTGDAELLQAMVDNLVRNAIHHSPAGQAVAIESRSEGPSVHIVVRDHGPGIPADYRERIFERFVQVPHDEVAERGTGLGLAIAHDVVQVHGGEIRIEDPDDGGCAFVVSLPARIEA